MAVVKPRTIRKFNPGILQSDQEVISQFVVRNRELDAVLEILRGNLVSSSCQHTLIVAPRGHGKTMLLQRVAAELRTNPALSQRLLPVRFMEESQEVFGIAGFWLETLFHLAREISGLHPEFAAELRETHDSLSQRWREQSIADVACTAVLEAAQYLDRRLVLMVENLQSLNDDVDQDFGWRLRKVLQTEPDIMLVASATSRFKSLDSVSEPFYELFRIIYLNPLDTEECGRLWNVVSGEVGTVGDIRPLEILTGGNPRLLVIVGGLAQHRSPRRLMEDLVNLIDNHTEYFRGHLEVMNKSERRVYVALIDLWQFSAAGEIAARARMDIRKVSTMLGRLVKRGAVTREFTGKKWMYVASERLYCLYYKLRRERDEAHIVRSLLSFMEAFYSEAELIAMFQGLGLTDPLTREIMERMLRTRDESPAAKRSLSVIMRQADAVSLTTEELDVKVQPASSMRHRPLKQLAGLMRSGRISLKSEDFQGAMQAFNEVVESYRGSDAEAIQQLTAEALSSVAGIHLHLGEFNSSVSAFERIIECFGSSDSAVLQQWVAAAFTGRAESRSGLGDESGALSDYNEVLKRYGAAASEAFRYSIARALIGKAANLRAAGDLKRTASTYQAFVKRFAETDSPFIKRQVAEAWFCLGSIWDELEDLHEASKAYDKVVSKFSDSAEVDLRALVAAALYNVGCIQHDPGNQQGAMNRYREVLQRFGTSDAPQLQLIVAMSLTNWGGMLFQQRDWEGAASKCAEVVKRFSDSQALPLQEQVLLAMQNSGILREKSGDLQGAMETYRAAVDRFGANESAEIQHRLTKVLFGIASIEITTGLPDLALKTCAEIGQKRQRFTEEQQARVAWQELHLRIRALLSLSRLQEAMNAFRGAYDVFEYRDEDMIRQLIKLVMLLVGAGALPKDILAVLTTNQAKEAAITPLVVALRLHAGDTVRAPEEVLLVAGDILDEMAGHSKL